MLVIEGDDINNSMSLQYNTKDVKVIALYLLTYYNWLAYRDTYRRTENVVVKEIMRTVT